MLGRAGLPDWTRLEGGCLHAWGSALSCGVRVVVSVGMNLASCAWWDSTNPWVLTCLPSLLPSMATLTLLATVEARHSWFGLQTHDVWIPWLVYVPGGPHTLQGGGQRYQRASSS